MSAYTSDIGEFAAPQSLTTRLLSVCVCGVLQTFREGGVSGNAEEQLQQLSQDKNQEKDPAKSTEVSTYGMVTASGYRLHYYSNSKYST